MLLYRFHTCHHEILSDSCILVQPPLPCNWIAFPLPCMCMFPHSDTGLAHMRLQNKYCVYRHYSGRKEPSNMIIKFILKVIIKIFMYLCSYHDTKRITRCSYCMPQCAFGIRLGSPCSLMHIPNEACTWCLLYNLYSYNLTDRKTINIYAHWNMIM